MNQDDRGNGNNTLNEQLAPPNSSPQPAEESTQSVPPPPVIPIHEPHTSKRKTFLIAACAIVLLALIGGLGYILTREHPSDQNSSTSTTTTPEETNRDTLSAAEQIVANLKTKTTGGLQQVNKTTEFGGTGSNDRYVYTAASYQTNDQKFAVYPMSSYGFGTTSAADVATSDMTAIESYLTENDFSEVVNDSGIYASKDTVCAVQLFDNETYGRDGIGVGCGNMDDYDKNYHDLLPFYNAYVASNPESTENLLMSSLLIKDGVSGYKNAHVSISSSLPDAVGGFAGLFYSTPPSGTWTFFKGTQSSLGCELFTTDDLKKAFSGQPCIDMTTNEEMTVKSE